MYVGYVRTQAYKLATHGQEAVGLWLQEYANNSCFVLVE